MPHLGVGAAQGAKKTGRDGVGIDRDVPEISEMGQEQVVVKIPDLVLVAELLGDIRTTAVF